MFARSALAVVAMVAVCSAAGGAHAGPPPLLVVEVAPEDHPAAQRLLELTEQPAQLVRLPEARDPQRTLHLARAAQAERVVIFDQGARRVVVVRTLDGSLLTRDTEASTAAPYLAAFVAIELLALPAPPLPPPPPPVHRPARMVSVLGLRAGLEVLGLSPYAGALRPALGLFATFHAQDAALGFRLELWGAPHASHAVATVGGPLTLTRDDLAARAGLVWQQRRLALSGFGQLGVAHIAATLAGPPHEQSDRTVLALGLGFEPSVQLFAWLALYASCGLVAHAPPGDYQVGGGSILRERRVQLTVGTGLYFTLPIR